MGKLIAKTAGITLAGLLALILILFGVFTVFFPSVMLRITDLCGMDRACTQYAVSVYTRTNDIDDLAEVAERAYYSESWQIAAEHGQMLMSRDDFEQYSNRRDALASGEGYASYKQEVAGIVSVAQYRLGNNSAALDAAFLYNSTSFESNNAAVTLTMTVIEANDKAFAESILARLKETAQNIGLDLEEDIQNLETLISVTESFLGQ